MCVRLCLCWMRDLIKIDQRLSVYFVAITFLHVACKTTRESLNDELLDILATTCLQSHYCRRYVNARHSSVLSLSLAVELMKVVANNSRRTVQLIEIEMSKAYLCRALRCKDSDSIYCLANVYLAVLCYITGQYQTAIDHCTLVERVQDRSFTVQFTCCTRRNFTEDGRQNRYRLRFGCVLPVRANSCIESTTTNTTCQRLYH